MNHTIKALAALLLWSLPSLLLAQGWVNDGAAVHISPQTTVYLEGSSLHHQNNGSITNDGTITLEEDWLQTNAATYTGTGWLSFEGDQPQHLITQNPLTVANVRIDNSHQLLLDNDLYITTALDLTNNGSLELGTNNLTLLTGANIHNYDSDHYIITNNVGHLEQTVSNSPVVFPIGNSSYNPATLKNEGMVEDFQIRVEDAVYDNGTLLNSGVVNRTWHIEEVSGIGNADVALTVQWHTDDELLFNRNHGELLRWDGNQWAQLFTYNVLNFASGMTYSQTATGLSDFSSFTVKEEAETTEQAVTTSPMATTNPARLHIYPNPVQDLVNIRLEGQHSPTGQVRLLAANGTLVLEREYTQSHTVLSSLEQLPAGTYHLQVLQKDGKTLQKTLVKR